MVANLVRRVLFFNRPLGGGGGDDVDLHAGGGTTRSNEEVRELAGTAS